KKIFKLEELLGGDDDLFINNLYRQILKREADSSGFKHYQEKLQKKEISRVQLIGAFCYSPEAKILGVKVVGLKGQFFSQLSSFILLIKTLVSNFWAWARQAFS
ncbi:MAG: DUF4214 domain-containing protein, partial [Candidatus Paceibacterota bacterium]